MEVNEIQDASIYRYGNHQQGYTSFFSKLEKVLF